LQLQEEVHEAQRKIAGQEEEIVKLKAALAARPRNPDARVLELQQEIQGFKLIAGTSPCMSVVSS
jgi:centromeric protein E